MAIQEVKVLSATDRSNGDKLVVQAQLVNGRRMVDIRAWFGDKSSGYQAGRKGISLSVEEFEALAKVKVDPKIWPAETEVTKVEGRKF